MTINDRDNPIRTVGRRVLHIQRGQPIYRTEFMQAVIFPYHTHLGEQTNNLLTNI